MKNVLLFMCLVLSGMCRADLTISNFRAGDVVRYPVVILNGSADGAEMAVGLSWKTAIRFPVVKNHYAAIVQLNPGKNMLLLHCGSETLKFRLDYYPMTSSYKVLAVYISAADESNTYYTTDPRDRFEVKKKLGIALKLMQAFTADAMNRAGYGRKTFGLELDHNGDVDVHFVKSPKTGAELRAMDANAIYSSVYDLLKTQFPETTTKWSGSLGFTRFNPETRKAEGHLALGGGSQALFGTGSMQWWPTSLKEVPKVFANTSVLDPNKTFEDSAYRHTVWANVSTAYGAALHELGHTFGLPHSPDVFSIMSRGFDYFSRSFTVIEAPGEGKKDSTSFKPDEIARWDPFFAARLNYSPWFQPDGDKGQRFETLEPSKIRFDGDDVVIDAPNGIRVVGAQNDGIPSWYIEHSERNPPKELKFSRKELRSKMQDTKLTFQIVVIDDAGNSVQIDDVLANSGKD